MPPTETATKQRWWGKCDGCHHDSDFLALLPGSHKKVCVGCYEDWRANPPLPEEDRG